MTRGWVSRAVVSSWSLPGSAYDASHHHPRGIVLALTYWRLQGYQIIAFFMCPVRWRSTTMKLVFAPDYDHPREYHQSVRQSTTITSTVGLWTAGSTGCAILASPVE